MWLSDAANRRTILSHAKVLRASANLYVKDTIYVSLDLKPLECQEGFLLRSELRRWQAAGDTNIFIHNETIVKHQSPTTQP